MQAERAEGYPPATGKEQTDYLLSTIKDWSILNGLAVRPSHDVVPPELDPSRSLAVTAPVTMFPSPFPRACFEEARAIQEAYNQLYAAIAADEKWLGEIVEELVEVDDFIKSLWEVHRAVRREGYVQDISLGIFRSDYMVHKDPTEEAKPEIRQVEFNTIASSFGGLAAKVSALHRHLVSVCAYPASSNDVLDLNALPINPSIDSITRGLALAHDAYGIPKAKSGYPLCVIFVVQDPENNIFDQLALSTHLLAVYGIPSFRIPFQDSIKQTRIENESNSRPLIYVPPHSPETPYEVTTLYFRAGYAPTEYSTSGAWEARLHLERSSAIKCPSILTHLAGSKKVQQILAEPSSRYLERFLSNTAFEDYGDRIRATFAAMYPLDRGDAGREGIKLATSAEHAQKYVLKPQREGGGNNIYGTEIPNFLKSLGDDESKYKGYILMELIEPPSVRNTVLRNGKVRSGEVIGELGIYGVCIWKNPIEKESLAILENYEAGFLLRTKGRESQEGGVAAGFGAVDSVVLVST